MRFCYLSLTVNARIFTVLVILTLNLAVLALCKSEGASNVHHNFSEFPPRGLLVSLRFILECCTHYVYTIMAKALVGSLQFVNNSMGHYDSANITYCWCSRYLLLHPRTDLGKFGMMERNKRRGYGFCNSHHLCTTKILTG